MNAKIDLTKPIRRKCDHHRIGGATPAIIVHGDPEAGSFHCTPAEFEAEYENTPEPPPRRIRIGQLEFYCHTRGTSGPLVYVSRFMPGFCKEGGPERVGKLYYTGLRDLRDWANSMLGDEK